MLQIISEELLHALNSSANISGLIKSKESFENHLAPLASTPFIVDGDDVAVYDSRCMTKKEIQAEFYKPLIKTIIRYDHKLKEMEQKFRCKKALSEPIPNICKEEKYQELQDKLNNAVDKLQDLKLVTIDRDGYLASNAILVAYKAISSLESLKNFTEHNSGVVTTAFAAHEPEYVTTHNYINPCLLWLSYIAEEVVVKTMILMVQVYFLSKTYTTCENPKPFLSDDFSALYEDIKNLPVLINNTSSEYIDSYIESIQEKCDRNDYIETISQGLTMAMMVPVAALSLSFIVVGLYGEVTASVTDLDFNIHSV